MSACGPHGSELVALGFWRGVSLQCATESARVPDQCALCNGSISIADVRACRCNAIGSPCPVHVGSRLVDRELRRAWSEFTWSLAGTLVGFPCSPVDKLKELFALSQASVDARAGVKIPLPPACGTEAVDLAPPPAVPLNVLVRLFKDGLHALVSSPSDRAPVAGSAAPSKRSRRRRRSPRSRLQEARPRGARPQPTRTSASRGDADDVSAPGSPTSTSSPAGMTPGTSSPATSSRRRAKGQARAASGAGDRRGGRGRAPARR
jgi:hypothetical protein